jgi:hypothetical protein
VPQRLFNATLPDGDSSEWGHVHDLNYLFRGGDSWTPEQVNALAGAAWNELGLQ